MNTAKKYKVLKPFFFRGVNRKVGDVMIIVDKKIDTIDATCIELFDENKKESTPEVPPTPPPADVPPSDLVPPLQS